MEVDAVAMARVVSEFKQGKLLVQATVTKLICLKQDISIIKLGGVCAGDASEQNQIMLCPCCSCYT